MARRSPALTLLLGVVLGLLAGAAPADDDGLPYEWVELGDGIYAALQPEANRFNDSNTLVIVNAGEVVVVDAQSRPADVEALVAKIRSVTDLPVRYLVNTHWHGDHTQANSVYRSRFPDVEILGHPTLLQDMPERAAPQLVEQADAYREAIPAAEERLRQGVSRSGEPLGEDGREALEGQIENARQRLAQMDSVEWVTPTLTVTERLTLVRGERRIEVHHHRGHTRGDLVVFLPREKILATGDLLDDLPYGGHGYPREWIATLEALEALDFETLVPGHGRIRNGKEHLRVVREMFQSIVDQVDRALEQDSTLEELQTAIDLAEYRRALAGDDPIAQRAFDQFIPTTVERAWLEARGELPD